jgi:hypothetical protein
MILVSLPLGGIFATLMISTLLGCQNVQRSTPESTQESKIQGAGNQGSQTLAPTQESSSENSSFLQKKFLGIECHAPTLSQTFEKNQPKVLTLIADINGEYDRYSPDDYYHSEYNTRKLYIKSRKEDKGYIYMVSKWNACNYYDLYLSKDPVKTQNKNTYTNAYTLLGLDKYYRPMMCNYLAIQARNSFPPLNETLYIQYDAGDPRKKVLKTFEIKVSGYQKLEEKIMLLSTTPIPTLMSLYYGPKLSGRMVLDKNGQFVGFADVAINRAIQIQVVSALSPVVKEDLKKNYFGHEDFYSSAVMPTEKTPELSKFNCNNSYSECELSVKKTN